MSVLKNLSVINELKVLFSKENLMYLDVILATLTTRTPDGPFDAFWLSFRKKFPAPGAYEAALTGLMKLHQIVRKQLNNQ